jgi:hypothetical protein
MTTGKFAASNTVFMMVLPVSSKVTVKRIRAMRPAYKRRARNAASNVTRSKSTRRSRTRTNQYTPASTKGAYTQEMSRNKDAWSTRWPIARGIRVKYA